MVTNRKQTLHLLTLTGRPEVDHLLEDVSWSNKTLTYSFLTPNSPKPTEQDTVMLGVDYTTLTPNLKDNILQAFHQISSFTKLSFAEADPGKEGDIVFGATRTIGESALEGAASVFGPYPDASKPVAYTWINYWAPYDYEHADLGNEAMLVLMHEIGHTLGLSHPRQDHFPEHDSHAFTLMSYNPSLGTDSGEISEDNNAPRSYMIDDIATLQHLYGKNLQTYQGDTTYQFSSDFVYETIWDAGGIDTISWKGKSTPAHINLQSGTHSFFGGVTLESNPKTRSQDSGILGIAFDTDIENATGGDGADRLVGNALNNTLSGEGNNDTLEGGRGQDRLKGGDGSDTFVYLSRHDSPTQGGAWDVIEDFRVNEGDRIDLSSIGTRPGIDGQILAFSLSGPQSYAVWYEARGNDGVVHVDTDGDSVADLSILLKGRPDIKRSSFILATDANVGAVVDADLEVADNADIATDVEVASTSESLRGTERNDVFKPLPSKKYSIDGLGGTDTAVYGGYGGALSVTLRKNESARVTLDGQDIGTLQSVENVVASRGDSFLVGDQKGNLLVGNDGDDQLFGNGGDDCLVGGGSDDRLVGGLGNDVIEGSDGHDTVDYSQRDEEISAHLKEGTWGTVDIGRSERDLVTTVEELIATAKDDTLLVEGGGFTLTGKAGADTFIFKPLLGSADAPTENVIRDFDQQEGDRLDFSQQSLEKWVSTWSTGPQAHSAWMETEKSDTIVYADWDGDAQADTIVRLEGVQTIKSVDIILAPEVGSDLVGAVLFDLIWSF